MNFPLKYILFILFIVFPFAVFAQHLVNKDGLKYGHWTDSSNDERRVIEVGMYKIISRFKYKFDAPISKGRGGVISTTYMNGYAILFYDNASDDSFAVRDGIWKQYTLAGKLISEFNYHEGMWLNVTWYDTNGHVSSRLRYDYRKNFSKSWEYENSRLQKIVFYPSLSEAASQTTYYPDDNLSITDGELFMKCVFGIKPADSFGLKITARKKALAITSIIAPPNFKVLDSAFKELSLPLNIATKNITMLNIVYSPTPESARDTEAIIINTDDLQNCQYKITVNTAAFHFDTQSAESAVYNTIMVNKSTDKFLRIPQLGTVWGVTIINAEGKETNYPGNGGEIMKIDLSAFTPGRYQFIVGACAVYSEMILIVKE